MLSTHGLGKLIFMVVLFRTDIGGFSTFIAVIARIHFLTLGFGDFLYLVSYVFHLFGLLG